MTMGSLKEMLRMVSPDECQALQDICEYNDITEEQLVSAPESITALEMFMHNLPRICCMSFFPNLVSLSLVQQSLTAIEGLHSCPYLKILRLSENSIQRIEGLNSCLRLQQLYLHGNQIRQIRNLNHLTGLEVLWLANNEIRRLEGLENLQCLKELNLACNPIDQLSEVLNLKSLEHLNVAATEIGSFKEIELLARLRRLQDLRFSDSNWGDSPLSRLHNYQTYVLFRLQHLQRLDTVDLADDVKQLAKATYTMKRVYYNMCVKSLQHNRNNIVCLSIKSEARRIRSLQKTLTKLVKTRKDLEKEMRQALQFEEYLASTTISCKDTQLLKREDWSIRTRAIIVALDDQISHMTMRLDLLKEETCLIKEKEQAAIDRKIHWLKLELDTGGNIRMEVGNSKDIWFKNCVDLVLARFCESDYAPFGITGVNVLKVMRIHNRLLQDRWEQQYERKVMKSKKRHAEYLLYGEALQCPNEFQRILEEGFPFFRGLFNQGFPRPVLLSNSIGLADVQRLQAISEKWQIFNNGRIRASGWLLVVKAFLGYSAQDLTVNFASPTTKKCTYPGADSVYKLHPTDSNQCSWLVFDSSLVVPEYLLEFKYNFKHEAASADPISQGDPKLQRSTSLKVLEEFLPRKGRGTWHCLPLDDPVRAAGKPKLLSDGIIDVHSPRHSSIVSEIFCHLSSSLILRNSNIKDLSKVTHLNLHNCNITNIETLEGLKNLEVLLLSFNKVTRMKGFAQLEVLKKLDLSYNLVKRIEVLEAVSNLVRLDLAGNEISVIEDIERLHSQIPALLHLSLKNNPIEERIGYRQMVLKAVPSLVKLDGISVAAEERVEAIKMVRMMDLMMMHNSSLKSHAISPNLTSLIPCDFGSTPTNALAAKEFKVESILPLEMQLTKDVKNEIWSKNNKRQSFGSQTFWEDENWLDGLEELHLESQQLKEMKGVGRLRSLRCLYLSANEISVIEGLESCTLLEELLLDDNHIREANWLPQFQMLWKLDISKNHLTSCVCFSGMKSLTQLSIERNKIHSLKGLECLQCLMELYAAKNDILDIKELIHLRALSKLMVLDLSGNGVCECPGYRSYSIYTMRRLKVFDGRIVAHAEIHAAREVHAGRLTRDMLEQQLGHCNFHQIEVLDLSSKSLRHCGDVFESGDFFGLLDLNLNNNLLCSIQAVRKLTKLVCLQIENNKIENGRLVDYCITSEEGSFSCERVLTHHSYAEVSRQSSEYPTGKTSQGFGAKIGLDSVKYLYLGGNIITSIASLHLSATFSNLKLLSLKKNRIAKVDGLVGLKLIEILILDDNNIKEFEPLCFAGLGYLRELHMKNNALHTLGPLEHLSSLEKLDLASNHLTSNRLGGLSSVEGLALLPKLSDLKLANNPMSRQPHYRVTIVRRLLQLRYLDGKEIAEVERLEAENFSGSKVWPASVPYCMDPSSMLENSSCASTTSHLLPAKVPVKLTCLNFEAMCSPSPNLSSGQTVLIRKTVLAGGQSRSKCGEFWEFK